MTVSTSTTFVLPEGRIATVPPERRGLRRDQVRLMVATGTGIVHRRARDLADHLAPGTVLVVNTSATRPAAVPAMSARGPVVVHLATEHDDGRWTVEVRRPDGAGPVLDADIGGRLALTGGGIAELQRPVAAGPGDRGVRLWLAILHLPTTAEEFQAAHGRPIRYGPDVGLSLADHQTIFATQPGSAEMASAARPFSHELVVQLIRRGVTIAPIVLHAGVSSQVHGEPPQAERFEVTEATARTVDAARHDARPVIAVGTTSVRALESALDTTTGRLRATAGWTDLVIGPGRGTTVVDGLLTGWHEPEASHLAMLEAVAGPALVQRAYDAAVGGPYLWHEFGDLCLLLPGGAPQRRRL